MTFKFDVATFNKTLLYSGIVILGLTFAEPYLRELDFGFFSGGSKESKARQNLQWKRLIEKNPELKDLELNSYEKSVLTSVITSEEIDISFKDIGGLESIISDLHEGVVYPLMLPELYENNPLLQAPSGVLLYGPPGCGKTMLAKALAKESGANFISIRMSSIMDKWYGESNKIVDAIFSLANKIQPCMIFIDEIDSFLRERTSTDHEVTATLKAEFMTLWDGLVSNGRIMIVGATNRINDIDSAFLRRLPKRFLISLPDKEQRLKILNVLLKDTKLDKKDFDIEFIASNTSGLSGSDLKELCREAALNAAKEYIRQKRELMKNSNDEEVTNKKIKMRPLKTSDFIANMKNDARQTVSSTSLD
ncbi:hypothetical protein Kpol_385p7 [Vanderwaltozyma polyspora DSM 70294]|uniref:AAA+ ATPase domain-containing protein n=1 Tax=Vanderwaltozyma polyspora (strain ATCC 22028 / DSM 70294 / BCRC 21397 / CBS 2163 / NBRC 10782 / NRRL Y-8283 / UCD 57-17) TaxID=436907 RepID=A7TS19_VANPO|nr:uncharacterized protein Kpol_385p7 [Vanderwaltozyma polyspora DSM 70294]EDO14938.1 hypothetical protein Kpol_385p7 [Vanderwaltozyma polyspora DSM 70294]